MAKYSNRKRHETGQIITTPSVFGSHKSMVVDHSEFGLELSNNEVLFRLIDDPNIQSILTGDYPFQSTKCIPELAQFYSCG